MNEFSLINEIKFSVTSYNSSLRRKLSYKKIKLQIHTAELCRLRTEHAYTYIHTHYTEGNRTRDVFVGIQSKLPQNIPLWHMNYFGLKAIKKPCRLRRNFYNSLKGFKFGTLSIIRVITRSNFYDQCIGQGKHLISEPLLFLLSCNDLPPSEAPRWSLALNAIYASFSLSVSKPLMHVGSLTLSCMWGIYVLNTCGIYVKHKLRMLGIYMYLFTFLLICLM